MNKTKNQACRRGYTLSLDAMLALLLVIAFIGFSRVVPFEAGTTSNLPKMQSVQRADDVFTTMINSGYMWQKIDEVGLNNEAAENIYAKMRGMLPDSVDFRIVIRKYQVNFDQCRLGKTFEACFPSDGLSERIAGKVPPVRSEVVHGRGVFVKKEPVGMCTVEGGLAPKEGGVSEKKSTAWLEGEMMGLEMTTSVDPPAPPCPPNSLLCDGTATTHLGLNAIAGEGRAPGHVLFGIDMGNPMGKRYVTQSGFNLVGPCSKLGTTMGTFQNTTDYSFTLKLSDCLGAKITAISPTLAEYGPGDYVDVYRPTALGTWTVQCSNKDALSCNVIMTRTNLEAGQMFLEGVVATTDWKLEGAEGPDEDAFTTFQDTTSTLLVPLTTDEDSVLPAIDGLLISQLGSNADVAAAVIAATDILKTTPEGEVRIFIPVTNIHTGGSIADAANYAKANGVVVYPVGAGYNSDMVALNELALITGGEAWLLTETDALIDYYTLMAQKLKESMINGNRIDNAQLRIPVPAGQLVTEHLGGEIIPEGEEEFLVYDLGTLDVGEGWSTDYSVVFQCNDDHACQSGNTRTFPQPVTEITYMDIDGLFGSVPWDPLVEVPFKYRDQEVKIMGGRIVGENQVYLDVNVANVGHLDTVDTSLRFYKDSTGDDGTYLTARGVSAMCGGLEAGCGDNEALYYDVPLAAEGYLYAIVNKLGENSECPTNSQDVILCQLGAKTEYYTIDYYVWPK
ncbi:MAG: VWA domain-containing protein [Candidatus Diapherotrites archaeon]